MKHQIEKKQQFISKSGAEKIAVKNCKGTVKSSELKTEHNAMVYVVQVSGQDGKLHTFHINCKNSKIVKHDIKNNQQHMTRAKAESFALSHCKGAVKSAQMKKKTAYQSMLSAYSARTASFIRSTWTAKAEKS